MNSADVMDPMDSDHDDVMDVYQPIQNPANDGVELYDVIGGALLLHPVQNPPFCILQLVYS
jgi:hypothetical protein